MPTKLFAKLFAKLFPIWINRDLTSPSEQKRIQLRKKRKRKSK